MGEVSFRTQKQQRGQTQALTLMLLLAGMLILVRARLKEHEAVAEPPMVVEVRGEVPNPGFHEVDPPRLSQAIRQAGGTPVGPDAILEPGTRVVWQAGAALLEPMDAQLVFGLPIPLNTASDVALRSIPGVGAKTAEAIVAYRETHGPFESVEDLDAVRGIGPATVQRIAPFVSLE